jgi:Rps23 Pro-64 3,4-dihydroxylase Tpa1-like proline 4-hydroxylase
MDSSGACAVIYDKPFRHAVIDNFIDAATVRKINEEWPAEWTLVEDGSFNKKWSTPNLTPSAKEVADGIQLSLIETATGLSELFPDSELFGAGLHCIPQGGFLKMHVDFNVHPKGWHRRANVLIYLNEGWDESWGGKLQLGLGGNAKKIAPIAGRCVIFETNDTSWHGHPEKLACPPDRQRRSMALYYYTEGAPDTEAHSTIYRKRAA